MDLSDIKIVKPRKAKTTPVGDLYNGTYIRLTPRSKWIYEKVSNPEVSAKTGNLLVKLEKLDTGDAKWIPPEQRVYLAEEFN